MRRRFAAYAWFVLAVQIVVVLWGAYVRASKSGAGCGESWPLCQGELLPTAPQLPTIIEFTHRITSGLALIAVLVLVVWAFRAFPPRSLVRRFAGWSAFFIVTESLVGAALVLLGHVADNPSTARGFTLSIHLVNTLFLLGSVSLTAWYARRKDARPLQLSRSLALAAVGLLAAGVIGAVAALGDTLFVAASVAEGVRDEFSAEAHPFVRIRILHPFVAALAGVYLMVLGFGAAGSTLTSPVGRKLALAMIALTLIQFGVGVVNILLLVPIPMQIVHLFFADALWIAFVLFAAEVG